MATENNLWGIHAGKTGDASSLFTRQDCVAVGWVEMGDLSLIAPDREAFKQKVFAVYPGIKPGAIPNYAGQLLGCNRFSRHGLKRIAPPRTVPDSYSLVLNAGV